MKYFFSAGEASGDIHAAQVIINLRQVDPEAMITFLGGDEMAAVAGHSPLIHYSRMAYMGFVDVARHLPAIFDNLAVAKRAIERERPDAVVLVDYPGFNMKIARYAHELGIPVHYYIAPKLWAWKEYRIKSLRLYVDYLYSILPFEPQWFDERGMKAVYVGNPSVEEVERTLSSLPPRDSFLALHGLDERPILLLVPGSRVGEIKANLPVMAEVAARHPETQTVVAGAPSISRDLYATLTSYPVIYGATLGLMRYAAGALVTSGTASLEAALAGVPQVVCYRAVGWKWAHDLFTHILKIPFCSLPNLVTGPIDRATRREVNRDAARTGVRGWIIPEMLVHNCTPEAVDAQLTPLLTDTPARRAQLAGYLKVRTALSTPVPAAEKVAELIYEHTATSARNGHHSDARP
ncbi:MAG: lipid-A-disaccharide synthase [Duncaniella sp.]|nr:lipid-A-disaccharide synthase [Duncaniella sp.]